MRRTEETTSGRGYAVETWRRLVRNRIAVLGMVIVLGFVILAVFAPYVAPHDPVDQDLTKHFERPSPGHPLGRDELGRDILSRVIYGARISLTIGLIAVGIGLGVGVPLGAISGYYGGKLDLFVQRIIDITLAFPGILLAIILVSTLGISLGNAMIAIGIVSIPVYVRLVRGSVLAARENEYVQAARAIGLGDFTIITRYILRNCLSPIIVQSTVHIPSAILWAAGLGFLGLGAQPPTPEWGAMLSGGRDYLRVAPHVATYPGLAIALTVLGFNLFGDGLRDALDPKMKL